MTRYLLIVCCCLIISSAGLAQSNSKPIGEEKSTTLPFKVLTSGKKITIQCAKNIKNLIAWTASGNRIVEQKNLNTKAYSFTVPSKENIVFVLMEFEDGKRHTHRIGLQ